MNMASIAQAPPDRVYDPAHEQTMPEPREYPRLRCNDGSPLDFSLIDWMRPTSVHAPLEDLRRNFEQDGYVLVKGLIPREAVLDMRENYFEHFRSTGILDPNRSAREGVFNPNANPADHTGIGAPDMAPNSFLLEILTEAHTIPPYLEFVSHPSLRSFIRKFMKWDKEVMLARTMLRHAVPGGPSTGIHYDQIFLRGGNPRHEFLTAWVPIGDISSSGGGLMYLTDSVALGRAIEADFTERAKGKGMSYEERINAFNSQMQKNGLLSHDAHDFLEKYSNMAPITRQRKWLIADYEAGDVVFHDPYMIHCASMNEDDKGRIRLSTDLRFYQEGMELDKRWLQVWNPTDGL